MVITLLKLLHNVTTFLFGIYLSAALLETRPSGRNTVALLLFTGGIGGVSLLLYFLLGESVTENLYPLLIHLPLVLFFTLFFKYRFVLSLLAVLTAYLCCQVSNWVGAAVLVLIPQEWVYYAVRIVATAAVLFVSLRTVTSITARLREKATKDLMILGLLPLVYYFYDYITSVYTDLLYAGIAVVAEFLGFILCLSFLLFLFLYFRQYEEKCEAEQRRQMMELQQLQAQREIAAIRHSEKAIAILRHDMRHFLQNVALCIEEGQTEKAKSYISEVIQTVESVATKKYCKNETVNMILSTYGEKMQDNAIMFQHTVQLPEHLPLSDVDLTSILSNCLENAIQAVLPLEPAQRRITLTLQMRHNKLLLYLKNSFKERPVLVDGLPRSEKKGHGIGTQSICCVVEKLHGNYLFAVQEDQFVLQIVL